MCIEFRLKEEEQVWRFLHNPKTGGMAITEAILDDPNLIITNQEEVDRYNKGWICTTCNSVMRHCYCKPTYSRHTPATHLAEGKTKYLPLTFCLIRHPVLHALSAYAYYRRHFIPTQNGPSRPAEFERFISDGYIPQQRAYINKAAIVLRYEDVFLTPEAPGISLTHPTITFATYRLLIKNVVNKGPSVTEQLQVAAEGDGQPLTTRYVHNLLNWLHNKLSKESSDILFSRFRYTLPLDLPFDPNEWVKPENTLTD